MGSNGLRPQIYQLNLHFESESPPDRPLKRFCYPERKKENSRKDFEQKVDGQAHNPKWEENKPDQGKQDQHHQRQGPAEYKQDAPENKADQCLHIKFSDTALAISLPDTKIIILTCSSA
jgi:hypothetical protein